LVPPAPSAPSAARPCADRSAKLVNDDGPPSPVSPYILPLVRALQAAGHRVSVAIPDTPMSWIGKAHLVGKTVDATIFSPDGGAVDDDPWFLVGGTPASCVQLGLFHLFSRKPPVDLVISGPNHGRNATTVYTLSSGTVGGALEAAQCRKHAVALSFASKDLQPTEVIQAACRLSVRLVHHLFWQWQHGVELYCVNVPMRKDVDERQVFYTVPQPSFWSKSSLFRDITADTNGVNGAKVQSHHRSQVRSFKWAPELSDIAHCVEESAVGTDAYQIKLGFTR
jgi:5'/3'-nucleotidase SurE